MSDKSDKAIAIAVISLIGTVATAAWKGCTDLSVQRIKDDDAASLEQVKFESGLILKAAETSDPAIARKNLVFFMKSGLIRTETTKNQITTLVKDSGHAPTIVPAEVQRFFLDEQTKLYTAILELTGKLSTLPEGKERTKAQEEFWKLAWGPMAMVEDQNVLDAKVAFGGCLSDPTCRNAPYAKNGRSKLQNFSIDLAHACRDALNAPEAPEASGQKPSRTEAR